MEKADLVLCICSPSYGRNVPGPSGSGQLWEYNLIQTLLLQSKGENHRFIPVLFEDESVSSIPLEIQRYRYYVVPRELPELLSLVRDASWRRLESSLESTPPAPPTIRTGRPPVEPEPAAMPDPRVHLDRIHQWNDLVKRCQDHRHQVFLLDGDENQYLEDFIQRVQNHLHDECHDRHCLFTVMTESDGYEQPTIPEIWEARLASALSKRSIPARAALQHAAAVDPAFIFFGDRPLNPRINREETAALLAFVDERLPAIIREAKPRKPVRLFFTIEESEDREWTTRFGTVLGRFAREIQGVYKYQPRVEYPPWADVDLFFHSFGLNPSPQVLKLVKDAYERHRSQNRCDFRLFCKDVDRLLRKVPRENEA